MDETPTFQPYLVSIGEVVLHDENGNYIVQCRDGSRRGYPAAGEPHPDAFESDLANPPVIPPPVPQSITPRQIRLWLVGAGISLDAILSKIPNESARIEWEYATEVRRDHPLVEQLRIALELTSGQVDDAFRVASTL